MYLQREDSLMATDNAVTLVGNMTREPELKFTQSGTAVASFGLAVNRRWPSRTTPGEWEEKVSFIDVVVWGQFAENVAESLPKGCRVIVHGRIDMNSWENDNGEKRSKLELVAESIGPDLKWATVEVTRNPRSGGDRGPDLASRTPDSASPGGSYPDEEPF